MTMRAILTLEHRGAAPQCHVIRLGETFTLGRGRDVTIRIEDERISRQHVKIGLSPAGIEVHELGSRNGTRVNGRVARKNERILAGRFAVVELGDARATIEVESAGEEGPTTRRLATALPDLENDFEVLGEIGHGATGKVFVAKQKKDGRTIAVKTLKPQFVPVAATRERFLREGKLAARINSPNVVQVYDVRVFEERAYIIMQLVQGPSAKDRLVQGPLPLADALGIGEDIANALAAAADAHVVHRDVKPGNILIDADGVAKLTDFGIAKDLNGSRIQTLTAAGDGLGTLAYVSPEQAQDAKTVDYRTDIYGLGATIFHLLAGRPPFMPTSARVLLDIIEKPAPPLTAFRPDAPEDLERLLDLMLEKEPDDRPQTAREVAKTIRELRLRLGLIRSAGASETFGGEVTADDLPAYQPDNGQTPSE
jgi:serine/threonine protein kinase